MDGRHLTLEPKFGGNDGHQPCLDKFSAMGPPWCQCSDLCCRSDVESLKRELQVLSEQYSQKCLEIGDLVAKAEEQEQILQHCQQEGKELLRHNQASGLLHPWMENEGGDERRTGL